MRMDECASELQALLEDDKLAGVPLLIYANKQDLISALDGDEIEDLQKMGFDFGRFVSDLQY